MISAEENEKKSANPRAVRLALVGAGTYARDAHIPSLLQLRDQFELVAIYSRTQETAATRAEQWFSATGVQPSVFTNIEALLAQETIDAVDILLPISLLPEAIEKALSAGKHVVSEKPIAPTVSQAQTLVASHGAYPAQVWMVAENWRYESAYRLAAELVQQGEIGQPLTCHFVLHLPVTPESKYWHTPWRRNWQIEGGWLVDGGVHHVAAIRAVMGNIASVQASARLVREELAPLDTMSATLNFENGAVGSYVVSYAAPAFWPPHLHVVGERGSLRIKRGKVECFGAEGLQTYECSALDGVQNELAAFAGAVTEGTPHLNTPEEALHDLMAIEAMLDSAQSGERITIG